MNVTRNSFRQNNKIVKEFPILATPGVETTVNGKVYTDFEGEHYLDSVEPNEALDSDLRVTSSRLFTHYLMHETTEPVLRTTVEELQRLGTLLEKEVLTSADIKDVEIGTRAAAYWAANSGSEGGRTEDGWTELSSVGAMLAAEKAIPTNTQWAIDLKSPSLLYYIPAQ